MSEVTTTKPKLNLKEVTNDKVHTFSDEKALQEKEKRKEGVTKPVFGNNGTKELKDFQKNKITGITCDKKEITPDELVTYTVKLDGKYKDRVKTEIKKVKFCIWLQYKNEQGKTVKLELDKNIIPAQVILIKKHNGSPRVTKLFNQFIEQVENGEQKVAAILNACEAEAQKAKPNSENSGISGFDLEEWV